MGGTRWSERKEREAGVFLPLAPSVLGGMFAVATFLEQEKPHLLQFSAQLHFFPLENLADLRGIERIFRIFQRVLNHSLLVGFSYLGPQGDG